MFFEHQKKKKKIQKKKKNKKIKKLNKKKKNQNRLYIKKFKNETCIDNATPTPTFKNEL
jgi:uncharacterized protein (DUF2147 family)